MVTIPAPQLKRDTSSATRNKSLYFDRLTQAYQTFDTNFQLWTWVHAADVTTFLSLSGKRWWPRKPKIEVCWRPHQGYVIIEAIEITHSLISICGLHEDKAYQFIAIRLIISPDNIIAPSCFVNKQSLWGTHINDTLNLFAFITESLIY